MSGDFRDKKGEDLVKYVASSTNQEEKKCGEILRILCSEDDVDVSMLEGLSEESLDKVLKAKAEELQSQQIEVAEFMDYVEKGRKVLGFARSLTYQNYLIINDPIHGTIQLHPLLMSIINCSHFQRLRHIKQLGGVSYVYPGATHTRFEHSIGVCHLAGEVMRNLKTKQPELGLTEKDVLGVEIAGLCHDLGHGPFSHMFEWVAKKICGKWKHEEISCKVIDALAKERSVRLAFQRFGLDISKDIAFVKNLIQGNETEERPYYLSKIVANKVSGCDVDKWDYYARDCHYLGIPCDFDCRRFTKSLRVANGELCFRDKEVNNVYGMFHTRGMLHLKALQHKTSQVVQHMMYEALLKVKDEKLLNGRTQKLSDVLAEARKGDLSGWNHLDDRFMFLIVDATQESSSTTPVTGEQQNLRDARTLLDKIETHSIYKFLGSIRVKKEQCEFFHKRFKSAHDITRHVSKDTSKPLLVLTAVISQSSESKQFPDRNPVDKVKFYKKEGPIKTFAIKSAQVSDVVKPCVYSETRLQIYNKGESAKSECCWMEVKKWAETYMNDQGQPVFEPVNEFQDRYLI